MITIKEVIFTESNGKEFAIKVGIKVEKSLLRKICQDIIFHLYEEEIDCQYSIVQEDDEM
jgi:hypothetical protein